MVESGKKPGGNWLCPASYPGAARRGRRAEPAVDAVHGADEKRIEIILDRLDHGMQIPVWRPAN
jgi:hypothetical protein